MGKPSEDTYIQCLNARVERFNQSKWPLKEGEAPCEVCGNKRLIAFNKKDYFTIRDCDCTTLQKEADALQRSGMYDLLMRYSFENFRILQPWQENMAKRAMACVPTDKWLLICGQSGCGKTHLATAFCRELIRLGQKVHCMRWPEEIKAICAARFDLARREQIMKPLLSSAVLLIDDLFKGRVNANGLPEVSAAEEDATFEIISHRYDQGKRTVITTEVPSGKLKALNEALYSRIHQRAGQFVMNISRAENRNLRLHCPA